MHVFCWQSSGVLNSVSIFGRIFLVLSGGKHVPKPTVKSLFETLEYGPAPESPAVADAWLDDHGRSFGHFINNEWVKPSGRKTYDTFNPATGAKLATTVQGTHAPAIALL